MLLGAAQEAAAQEDAQNGREQSGDEVPADLTGEETRQQCRFARQRCRVVDDRPICLDRSQLRLDEVVGVR